MQTLVVANAITAVGPSAAVQVRPKCHRMTVQVSITGGTARTGTFQVATREAGPWADVGISRTAIGEFVEDIPAAPHVRFNLSANTGSTVSAWVYTDTPAEAR